MAFHNEPNYDYHFIIKKLAEEFEQYLLVYEEALKNTQTLQFHRRKKLRIKELIKMEKKLQKNTLQITIY